MLAWLYCEREADRIIRVARSRRQNRQRTKMGKKKKETLGADINAIIENDKEMGTGLIKQVNEKYRKVIYDE